MHPRTGYGSSTPARMAALDRFLVAAKAVSGLAFLTCRALADHCLADRMAWTESRL